MQYKEIKKPKYFPGVVDVCALSCAFLEARVVGTPHEGRYDWFNDRTGRPETRKRFEKRLRESLAEIIDSAKEIPVTVCSTDEEPEWKELLQTCPHAKLLAEVRTQMENYELGETRREQYKVQRWFFDLRGNNETAA